MADDGISVPNSGAESAPLTPEERKRRMTAGLKPWPKGVSGNPKGRPKSLAARFEEMEAQMPVTTEELMFKAAHGQLPDFRARERLEAMRWVLERKHGKTPDITLNVEATGSVAEAFVDLTKEQLVSLASQPVDAAPILASQTVLDAVPEPVPEANVSESLDNSEG